MPFMEPFLPYYDTIRQSPDFVELLAEHHSYDPAVH
jgi:hypothetical protein